MSLDARYILKYENLPYLSPTPQEKDKLFLEKTYGGEVIKFDIYESYYYKKPKYVLMSEDVEKLLADQILECQDCSFWKIIK
jgi:hypothetical protein